MVIVIRKDLKMRRGKEIAQAAHGALMWLTKRMDPDHRDMYHHSHEIYLTPAQVHWLDNSYRKVTLRVDSEKELDDLHAAASMAGVESHMVVDNGLTEVAPNTKTCLVIGPDYDEKIDLITGKLTTY